MLSATNQSPVSTGLECNWKTLALHPRAASREMVSQVEPDEAGGNGVPEVTAEEEDEDVD